MKRLLLSLLGLLALGWGVVQLAEATMTRHEPVPSHSRMAVEVAARTKGHTAYSRLQMTRSLFMACRLQTNMTVLGEEFEVLQDSFRFVIQPALDDSDQRQLHGCLEDARIDQLQVEVVAIDQLATTAGTALSGEPSAARPVGGW